EYRRHEHKAHGRPGEDDVQHTEDSNCDAVSDEGKLKGLKLGGDWGHVGPWLVQMGFWHRDRWLLDFPRLYEIGDRPALRGRQLASKTPHRVCPIGNDLI